MAAQSSQDIPTGSEAPIPSFDSPAIPNEIKEKIYFLIEDARDLKSMALTAKMHTVAIIPGHLYFRRISCSLNDVAFWTSISQRPDCLKYVEWLDLNNGRLSPGFFNTFAWQSTVEVKEGAPLEPLTSELTDTPETIASSKALVTAIQYMNYLTRFRADFFSLTNCSNIFLEKLCNPDKFTNLNELDVTFNLDGSITAGQIALFVPLFNFRTLTHVVITISESRYPNPPELASERNWGTKLLDEFSRTCPSLTKLCLSYKHFSPWETPAVPHADPALDLTNIFANGQWPLLSHLTLKLPGWGVVIRDPDEGVVAKFFKGHPSLKALSLHTDSTFENLVGEHLRSNEIRVPGGSLPNLEAFSSSETIHTLSIDVMARLTFLHAVKIMEDDFDHLINLGSLQTCITKCSPALFEKLLKAAPNIEKLSLEIQDSPLNKYEAIEPYVAAISTMQRLTHLAGFTRLIELTEDANDQKDPKGPIDSNAAVDLLYLHRLARVKTLTYIQLTVEQELAWIFLERNSQSKDDVNSNGYRRAEGVCDVSTWGDIFEGLEGV